MSGSSARYSYDNRRYNDNDYNCGRNYNYDKRDRDDRDSTDSSRHNNRKRRGVDYDNTPQLLNCSSSSFCGYASSFRTQASPACERGPFDKLPDIVVVEIFKNLDTKSRLCVESVCRRFQALTPLSWSKTTQFVYCDHRNVPEQERVLQLFRRLRECGAGLTRLVISGGSLLAVDRLREISDLCPNVRELYVNTNLLENSYVHSSRVTSKRVGRFLKSFSKLQTLSLHGVKVATAYEEQAHDLYVSQLTFFSGTPMLDNLEHLELSRMPNLSLELFKKASVRMVRVKSLIIALINFLQVPFVSNEFFDSLENLVLLKELTITAEYFCNSELSAIADVAPKLEFLQINLSSITLDYDDLEYFVFSTPSLRVFMLNSWFGAQSAFTLNALFRRPAEFTKLYAFLSILDRHNVSSRDPNRKVLQDLMVASDASPCCCVNACQPGFTCHLQQRCIGVQNLDFRLDHYWNYHVQFRGHSSEYDATPVAIPAAAVAAAAAASNQ